MTLSPDVSGRMSAANAWRVASPLLLAAIGVCAPLLASRGFTAFTTDTARAYAVAAAPRTVPTVALLNADSVVQPLGGDGRTLIVDFIATRCQTLCAAQNGIYQQLQRTIQTQGLSQRVHLVTISFDPAWDTPRALRYFTMAQRPDASVWSVLTPADSSALRPLLDTFGIRVIRDGDEFVHNSALHVVSADRKLVAILPVSAADDALAIASALSAREP